MDRVTLQKLDQIFESARKGGSFGKSEYKSYLRKATKAGIDPTLAKDFAYQNKGIWKADEFQDEYYVSDFYDNNSIDYGSITYNYNTKEIEVTPAREDFYTDFSTSMPTRVEKKAIGFTDVYLDDSGETDAYYATYKINVVAIRPDGTESIVYTNSAEKVRVRPDREDGGYKSLGSLASEKVEDVEYYADREYKDLKKEIEDYSKAYNKFARDRKEEAEKESEVGRDINNAYDRTLQQASRSVKGEYVKRRDKLNNTVSDIPDEIKDGVLGSYRTFYLENVVTPYDTDITAKPPAGAFDSNFYLDKYSDVKDVYQSAVDIDDVDVIGTYRTPQIWAEGHYTHTGRYERRRANEEEDTTITDAYELDAPTDLEKEQIRDRQLGITATPEEPLIGRLKDNDLVDSLWEQVKEGNIKNYNKRAEEEGFNYRSFSDFVVAFLTSQREKDLELKDELINNGTLLPGEETITDLEDALERAAGDETREQLKDFGALAENVLKDTLKEIERAKALETQFDMYSSFGMFGEAMNPGAGITESILGDSGIGGYMGFLGQDYGDRMEENVNNLFGVGNIATKNWQDWFDRTLTENYAREYDNLFKNLEIKRNILEAAAPNSRDYVDYVNANQDLSEKYLEHVRRTPEKKRKTKAEWGKRYYEKHGNSENYDISMLDKQIYDQETGEFTADFLKTSYFENTKDVEDYLKSVEETALLDRLKAEDFKSFNFTDELASINEAIDNVDSEEYNIILNSFIGEEEVDSQFVRDFMNDYLKPRFDQSKSMAEFRDYINVDPDVQNPFQTQNIIDALKATAQLRADEYMQEINGAIDQNFDPSFYFNPTEGYEATTELAYDIRNNFQKEIVEQDYQAALSGEVDPDTGIDWVAEMYRYGVPVTYEEGTRSGYYDNIKSIDRDAFARMHYQVKGSKGVTDPRDSNKTFMFRPALNVADPERIKRYIYYEVMPMLEEEATDIGTVFGQFVTPEEFADDVLSTYNLENKEELEELLKQYGLEDIGDMGELRDQLIEVISTNDAIAIREGIKYMNEQGKRPDQKNLGIQYIEREEDYKPDIAADTEIFKIFQSAGYKGTETQFYEEFLPGQDEEELKFLEDAMTGLRFDVGDFSDPFSMMVATERYFPDTEEESLSYEFGGEDTDDLTQRYESVYGTENLFGSDSGYNNYYDTLYDSSSSKYDTPKSKYGSKFLTEFTRGFGMGEKYKSKSMIY